MANELIEETMSPAPNVHSVQRWFCALPSVQRFSASNRTRLFSSDLQFC